VVWAAGVQASPLAARLAEASGGEVDRAGRLLVRPDLTVPGHPEVFALGDMVSVGGLPGVAEVAMQGSLFAANTILRRLEGHPTPAAFKYRDVGSVATVGRFRAIFSLGRVSLSGFPAWLLWCFVHLAFLNGFGRRLLTFVGWLRSFIGSTRPERVFSVGHTGGDLSAPDSVLSAIMPFRFPAAVPADRAGKDDEQPDHAG
jgi:NADH dehydrogenase